MKIKKEKSGFLPVEVEYYVGEDLESPEEYLEWAKEEFGVKVIRSMIHQSLLRDIRAKISSLLVDPDNVDQEKIQEIISGWKPGVAVPRTGMKKSVREYLEQKRAELGDEEFIEFLKSQLEA